MWNKQEQDRNYWQTLAISSRNYYIIIQPYKFIKHYLLVYKIVIQSGHQNQLLTWDQ